MNCLSFRFLLGFIYLILAACGGPGGLSFKQQSKQTPGMYSINGLLTGWDADSAWIYLCHSDRPVMDARYDSALLKKGRFTFSGKLIETGPFLIGLPSRDGDGKVTQSKVFHGPFILDEGNLIIEGQIDSLNNIRAWGTEGQDAYNGYKSLVRPLVKRQNSLYRQRNSTKGSELERLYQIDNALDSVYLEIGARVSDHVNRNPS